MSANQEKGGNLETLDQVHSRMMLRRERELKVEVRKDLTVDKSKEGTCILLSCFKI